MALTKPSHSRWHELSVDFFFHLVSSSCHCQFFLLMGGGAKARVWGPRSQQTLDGLTYILSYLQVVFFFQPEASSLYILPILQLKLLCILSLEGGVWGR